MKRSKFLVILSHDHHHGLKLAQLINKNAPKYKNLPNDIEGKVNYTINFWKSNLSKHFKEEERILFPPVKGKSAELDLLIDEIINEHKLIKDKIESLKEGGNPEIILNDLSVMLKNHIRKEERTLFGRIELILETSELIKIEKRINKSHSIW